jgi:hypothetical protein
MVLIEYPDFVQRVRRHRPSELIPALASTAIRLFEQDAWIADRVCLPWAIAAAAKASIVSGNEHRRPGVSENDVREICAAYNSLNTPLAPEPDDESDVSETVGALFVRTAQEQFPYQQSRFEEISRLGALFADVDALDTEILSNPLIERVLGCSLQDFVVAGFVSAVGAQSSGGFFDPDWPALREGTHAINPHYSIDTVKRIFHDHFVASFADIRSAAARWEQADARLRHHEFNPLVNRPFVTLPDGRHIAPQPHLVFQRLSPAALYYAGVNSLDKKEANEFTRDVGLVFQEYIGRQLRLIPNATVLPEIVYDDSQRSVDWFVIFDDLVLLVEVKSTRLSHLGRMDANKLKEDIKRCIGDAYKQVERTDLLLSEKHPAFTGIPTDRPRIAIVATLEPYWAANSPFMTKFLSEPAIPTTVASAREIGRLVDVVCALGGPQPLVDIVTDQERRTWNLENALPDIAVVKNPILDEAWQRYPFA